MRGNRKLKFIDRTVGYVILLALRVFKKPHLIENPKSIVFFVPAAIGDALLVGLIAEDLKRLRPDTKIYFLGSQESMMVAPFFNQTYHSVSKLDVKDFFGSVNIIRNLHVDAFIDFGQWSKISAIYSFFSNGMRIGFRTKGFWRSFCYDVSVDHSNSVHEFSNFRDLVAKSLRIDLSEAPHFLMESTTTNSKKIVVHMMPSGERSHLKMWPDRNWFQVIRYLTQEGYDVNITGSKADREPMEKFLKEFQLVDSPLVHLRAGNLSLSQTKDLISESKLIISVNTGIMHLASLMNKNVISLNGPTNAKRWGGLGKNTINIQSSLPCSPCLNLGFEYASNANDCMREISVDEVVEKIRIQLA
jgi:ADP-heptose:LPS heptosyltransferase